MGVETEVARGAHERICGGWRAGGGSVVCVGRRSQR